MSEGKVKSVKVKVHSLPEGTVEADGQYHVYVFDVFHKTFLAGKSFENVQRAAQFRRHEQERIYREQEADPELFDLPFISSDADLVARVARDAEYRTLLVKELGAEARGRARRH